MVAQIMIFNLLKIGKLMIFGRRMKKTIDGRKVRIIWRLVLAGENLN